MNLTDKTAARFAERLRSTRRARGLNQVQLSNRTRIDNTHISHYEAGRKVPCLQALVSLAVALEVSVDFLLGMHADDDDGALAGLSLRDSGLSLRDRALVRSLVATMRGLE